MQAPWGSQARVGGEAFPGHRSRGALRAVTPHAAAGPRATRAEQPGYRRRLGSKGGKKKKGVKDPKAHCYKLHSPTLTA